MVDNKYGLRMMSCISLDQGLKSFVRRPNNCGLPVFVVNRHRARADKPIHAATYNLILHVTMYFLLYNRAMIYLSS